MVLGIDIGGTTVKFGIVNEKGEIVKHKAYDTASWDKENVFVEEFKKTILKFYSDHPEIQGIGMGWPGLLSVDRERVLLLPNIKSVKDVAFAQLIREALPDKVPVTMDNDAKCAAMGEMVYGGHQSLDDFMLIALGTGVGSGAVMNGRLFLGARGNGTEIGHTITSTGLTLEEQLGQKRISNYAKSLLDENPNIQSSLRGNKISPKTIFQAAEDGDQFAKDVFNHLGTILGESIVSITRILDITTYILGGGVAGAFKYLEPRIMEQVHKYLPSYYTDEFIVKKSTINENAGILGAAGLLTKRLEIFGDVLE